MDEYYYDYGWIWGDNKEQAYKTSAKNLRYRVIKYHRTKDMELMTEPMPMEEAIEKLKQIKLLDPVGQQDWVEAWEEEKRERQGAMYSYLQSKGRL